MTSLVKQNRYILIFGGILFGALLLGPTPQAAGEEEGAAASSSGEETPCRGLKPFKNIDELLYQFYINLDSDCLFKMPVAELEKIWGIKILSRERLKEGQGLYQIEKTSDFYYKPYNSDKDAFYLVSSPSLRQPEMNYFRIAITRAYYNRHHTIFPDAKFPKSLPEPLAIKSKYLWHPPQPQHQPMFQGRHYPQYYYYYWYSSDKTGVISLGGEYGVTKINIGRENKTINEQQ